MSHHYGQPYGPTPKKGISGLAVSLIALAALAGGCVGGIVLGAAGSTASDRTPLSAAVASDATPAYRGKTSQPTPEPVVYTPKPSDFSIKVNTLNDDCWGSAGCIVKFQIEPAYNGPGLPDGQSYRVAYKVTDGHGKRKLSSFTMAADGSASIDEEERISTAAESYKLTGKVTNVIVN